MSNVRQVIIEDHAYDRYCERVKWITRDALHNTIHQKMQDGMYHRDGYVRIGNVWWRGTVTPDKITLHSCYGITHIDVPRAIKWAKRFRDRLALGEMTWQ